ncbi:MAG: sulfatase [Acidobacteriota bacterium]
MNRRTFLQTLPAAGAMAQGRRRNIVFILVDDQRYDFAGALGHPWVKTPHLDRLIRGGVHFQNAFVTTSLCSPSRASILTGLYMHGHRVVDNFTPLNPAVPAFPRLLQKAGYRTGFIGKWHMGGESDEPRPGFDHWFSFFGQGQYVDPPVNVNGRRETRPGYMTDILTDEALGFIRNNKQRPFLLYLAHKAVHFPFEPAPRHRDLYATAPVPRPKSMNYVQEDYEQRPEWVRRRRYTRHGVDGMFGHALSFDEAYRGYARSLAAVDESLGRILTELEETRLLNDTLVVYMGDNGYMWGEHGLVDKRAMYEPSMRVPLAAYGPGMFEPRAAPQLVLNLDLAPTFLECAGVAPPTVLHGRSLWPLLRGAAPNWRSDFLYEYEWEFDYPYTPALTGLRTERYSYSQSYGLWDIDELYDIRDDPDQMKNLLGGVRVLRGRGRMVEQIRDPELRKLVDSLQERLAQILAETGGDVRRAGKPPAGLQHAL